VARRGLDAPALPTGLSLPSRSSPTPHFPAPFAHRHPPAVPYASGRQPDLRASVGVRHLHAGLGCRGAFFFSRARKSTPDGIANKPVAQMLIWIPMTAGSRSYLYINSPGGCGHRRVLAIFDHHPVRQNRSGGHHLRPRSGGGAWAPFSCGRHQGPSGWPLSPPAGS